VEFDQKQLELRSRSQFPENNVIPEDAQKKISTTDLHKSGLNKSNFQTDFFKLEDPDALKIEEDLVIDSVYFPSQDD